MNCEITFIKKPNSDSISVDELGLTVNNITYLIITIIDFEKIRCNGFIN